MFIKIFRGPVLLKADNAHTYSFDLYNTGGITPAHNWSGQVFMCVSFWIVFLLEYILPLFKNSLVSFVGEVSCTHCPTLFLFIFSM